MFHAAARASYDAALAMYHDQALIPIKTLAFDEAVNVTLGLPFVRTSPDHGTAFDIAGKGVARPDSLIAALQLAARLAARPADRRRMSQIDDLPPLREVVARTGSWPKKSLGQNFLFDLNLTEPDRPRRRAARGRDGHRGRPRTGRPDPRAARGRREEVIAIERDPRCLPALAEIAAHYPGRLEVDRGGCAGIRPAPAGRRRRRRASSPTCPTMSGTALLTGWLAGRGLAALVARR